MLVFMATLAGSTHPVAAQAIDPQLCADAKDQRQYLLDNPVIQNTGLREGVDLLAEADMLIEAVCGEPAPARDPPTSPTAGAPAATPAPQPTAPPTPEPSSDSADRTDACNLLTPAEVGAVIGGAANADTPADLPGASGCEYRPDGDGNQPYLDVIYAQDDGNGVYALLLGGPVQNGDSPRTTISGVGENAFTYIGANGPGVVVLKANKVVVLEFGYTNPGETALLTLARQATARVR